MLYIQTMMEKMGKILLRCMDNPQCLSTLFARGNKSLFVPHLFEEKYRGTVFGLLWCMVQDL